MRTANNCPTGPTREKTAVDELQALRELFSSPEPLPESAVRRQREKLMTIIESTPTTDPHPRDRSRRRRAVLLITMPAAAVAVAAAGWAMAHNEPRDASDAAGFSCQADGVTAILPNNGTSPVETCRSLWESGAILPDVTIAPPLVACVDGPAVAVIEADGPNPCDAAGMAEWTGQADYLAVGSAIRAVQQSLPHRYDTTGNGCATEQEWTTGLANQPGAQGWTIEVDQIQPDRLCFDIGSIDPATRTVTIVGLPSNFSND
jgi:hypothetical protein